MKDFLLFFTLQALSYCIVTINFRAVAHGNLAVALLTDAFNASFSFFIIRRIARAKNEESYIGWLGYLCGSLLGTTAGMYIQ